MTAFNFMETFFFLSLGITFVLLLLLVYHFKQRITKTEEKVDTLFDIIQSLAKETSDLRSHITVSNNSGLCPSLLDVRRTSNSSGNETNFGVRLGSMYQPPVFSGNQMFSQFHMMNTNMDENEDNMNIHIQELDLGEENEIENLDEIMDITEHIEEDEEDEEDEDEDEDEEDEDEDEDEDDEDDNVIEQPFIKIKIEDDILPETNETNNIEDIHPNSSGNEDTIAPQEVGLVLEDNNMIIGEHASDEMKSYKKMSLNMLKQLVVSKSLVKDASKLKKNEILELLSAVDQGPALS